MSTYIVHVVVASIAPDRDVAEAQRHQMRFGIAVLDHVFFNVPGTIDFVTNQTHPVFSLEFNLKKLLVAFRLFF